MRAEDAMSAPVYALRPDDSIYHARNEMISRGLSKFPVVGEDEELLGIISKSDVVFSSDYQLPPEKRTPMSERFVEDVMTRRPWSVEPQTSLENVVEGMATRNVSAAPVTEEGRVLGIVTETDALRHADPWIRGRFQVRGLMTEDVEVVHRHTTLAKVVQRMEETRVHQLPVREFEDTLVGIITMSDVAFGRWFEPRLSHDKRIKQTRKGEPGGRKDRRDVETVHGVVEDAMSEHVTTVEAGKDASTAAHIMVNEGYNALPVTTDGGEATAEVGPEARAGAPRLVGIITRTDLLRAVADYEGELRPLSSPQR